MNVNPTANAIQVRLEEFLEERSDEGGKNGWCRSRDLNPQSFKNIPPGLANSHAVSTVTVLQKVTVQNRVDSKRPQTFHR